MPVCENCGKQDFTLVATKIREGDGKISKCQNCDLIIQELDWDSAALRKYYEAEYQSTNSLVTGEQQTPNGHFNDRIRTIQSIFDQVKSYLTPDSKVLDVGCGAGELLSLIKPHVKQCVGVEVNTPFVEFIQQSLGIEAYAGDINKLVLCEKYDLIICISTLDHLPNPLETLVSMKNLLTPKGKIYLEVPNINEALNKHLPEKTRNMYNEFFWHRAHLFYFSEKTISELFKKAGLNINVTCRHEYTLKNLLNWYFTGKPQPDFVMGLTDVGLFSEESEFGKRMNAMFANMDEQFRGIMAETFSGDNLCCIGYV